MSDIFKLFDGGAVSVEGQYGSSFSDVSPENDLVARLSSGTDFVDLKVDYSDFSNFVTFNSAESYVTITADQILNEYPLAGTVDDLQAFKDSLDGYQRYFLENWPSRTGMVALGPSYSSSYVQVNDFGMQDGVSRTSFVSPGTGSLSITGWLLPGNIYQFGPQKSIVFQKVVPGSNDGITVYMSGTGPFHQSELYFRVTSGSTTIEVSGSLNEYYQNFFSAVIERTPGSLTGSVAIYMGLTGSFPTISGTAPTPMVLGTRFDLGSGSFYLGSGSIPSGVTQLYSGQMDDIAVWSTVRNPAVLTSSYNRKIYSQPGLLGAWRFNEATPSTPSSYASIARDCSGHRLDGRIQGYFWGCRTSGSLTNDSPDPILTLDDPDVVNYVVDAQGSGSLYDRSNQTLIWRLFPEAFIQQDPLSAEIFKNFALIMARGFDQVKLYIDQIVNMRRVNYGDFDQAPDEFLEDVGRELGWDMHGSFVNTDGLRYFLGRGVGSGVQNNVTLDTKLSDIKSQFWKRSLLNLLYIYKTKGTRESVEALLRTYGADNGFIRLKEYARKSEARVPVERVLAEKSVYALPFSGTYLDPVNSLVNVSPQVRPANSGTFQIGTSGNFSVEVRICFPTTSSLDLQSTIISGSIFTLTTGSSNPLIFAYEKASIGSTTGNLFLTSSAGRLVLPSASIFTDDFYNLAVVRESTTGSITISVLRYENDELVYSTSSVGLVGATGTPAAQVYDNVFLGSWSGSYPSGNAGEYWAQELRLWDANLIGSELDDHARNFMSYGREVSYGNTDLKVHWRLDKLHDVNGLGGIAVTGSTPIRVDGYGSPFPNQSPYAVGKKFLLDYSYIPSIEYGWNQKKIRTFSGSSVDPYDAYTDENIISLEFNMYDALNEDISNVMASYDEMNFALGLPVNKFRPEYDRLRQMRETYFKRLQGDLRLRAFIDMMDFFDVSFVKIVERLLPARAIFKGDETVVESHMLERPKYRYGIRPIREGTLDISGSISLVDRDESWP